MQASSLDSVTHPRAFQPLDQKTEVRLKDNYYVARIILLFLEIGNFSITLVIATFLFIKSWTQGLESAIVDL